MGPEDHTQEGAQPSAEAGESSAVAVAYERVTGALAAHDKPTAVRTAVEAVTSGALTIPELYRDVLAPILADTGAAWQRGAVAVWEEHLASASVRTIVEILYPGVLKAKAAAAPSGRAVLLACPPEEAHDLGLRMVSDRFDMAGWTTYYLGPDTPVDEIAAAAARLGVQAIVMTSSTHYHRLAVRHAVDELKRVLPTVDVWVGGPAFSGGAPGWSPQELVDLDELLGETTARDDAGEGPADVDGQPAPASTESAPAAADETREPHDGSPGEG
jgi:MerR family transcriptional regulator, light-induced transcriptional regulator